MSLKVGFRRNAKTQILPVVLHVRRGARPFENALRQVSRNERYSADGLHGRSQKPSNNGRILHQCLYLVIKNELQWNIIVVRFSDLRPAPSLRDDESRRILIAILVPAVAVGRWLGTTRDDYCGDDVLIRLVSASRHFRRLDARAVAALREAAEADMRREGEAAALARAASALSPALRESAAMLAALVAGAVAEAPASAERAAMVVAGPLELSTVATESVRRVARALATGTED